MADSNLIRGTVLAVLVVIAGCSELSGDPKEARVREGVVLVQKLLNGTRQNVMAGLVFEEMTEQGGNAVSYVAANLPENAAFTCFVDGIAKMPYCVTIRSGEVPEEFIIEGYGKNIDKPILVEKATVGMPRRKGQSKE